jgi:hypothetical protein
MKISAQYPGIPATPPAINRPTVAADVAPAPAQAPVSPQERLAKLIEEKHAIAEAAMQAPSAEPELGKLIDLRV